MKKIRLRTIFIYILAILSGALLLHTSQNVQKAEEQLGQINQDVAREQESIHVLKTEWAYLNNPERLENLARQYLGLAPSDPAHIATSGKAIPAKPDPSADSALQAQPVSLAPPSKPSPHVLKSPPLKSLKEKSLNDLITEVTKEGGQ